MFISNAFAQAAEAAPEAAADMSFMNLMPIILIFVIFYFLIIRPQSKKIKEHQATINNLKIGNKVITTGGIIGVVKEIHAEQNQIEVEIADGVNVKLLRSHVADLVSNLEKKSDKKPEKHSEKKTEKKAEKKSHKK